ncbi:hypothetical protein [Paracidovorax wautersii]|uniref:Uncharacterized protein n=1 Tax=Paracidovorax wautersii TaxID=1177982 RepID=A0A1I2HW32_9BURK|nr:hypothetical protein [Paracidovorax wautersii]SFF32947.1 hypothetical protein SAMN04489711_1327 [Paracidovorax wautersii]
MLNQQAHVIVPLELHDPADRPAAAAALDRLLKAMGESYAHRNHAFSISAHESLEAANAAITNPGRGVLGPDTQGFQIENTDLDHSICIKVSSLDGSQLATVQLLKAALDEHVLQTLITKAAEPEYTDAHETLDAAMRRPSSFRWALLKPVIYDVLTDIANHLPNSPYTEYVDLSERGSYVKDAWDVDPVDTAFSDPYAVSNRIWEKNTEYGISNDRIAVGEAIKLAWTDGAAEDVMPLATTLGFSEEEIEEYLDQFASELLDHRGGSVELQPQGTVSINARPTRAGQEIYITFDGISSSRLNAVVDEDFLAMLDALKVDPKAWVDYLATSSGMSKPNWDIDLQGIISDHLHHARFDSETGYHWEGETVAKGIRDALMQTIFSPRSNAIEAQKIEQVVALRKQYREAIKNDASEADQQSLRLRIEEAQAACFDEGNPDYDTATYLMDIALEVVKAKAEDLDAQWLTEAGVDLNKLGTIQSSREQLVAFPQMAQMPNYYMAVANLNTAGSLNYEWSTPAHTATNGNALIALSDLASIMDNAAYSGTFMFSFDCGLDTLQEIGVASQGGEAANKAVRINGAYAHIHCFNNGAGAAEQLSAPLIIPLIDLASKKWDLRNDATNSYGVAGVFGDFLASDCRVELRDAEPAQQLQREQEPALAP